MSEVITSTSTLPASRPTTRLDMSGLEDTICKLFSAGLAVSTRRVYRSETNRYLKFCSKALIHHSQLRNVHYVCLWVTCFKKDYLARRLKAIYQQLGTLKLPWDWAILEWQLCLNWNTLPRGSRDSLVKVRPLGFRLPHQFYVSCAQYGSLCRIVRMQPCYGRRASVFFWLPSVG